MSESNPTKDELAEALDAARAENEHLRGQLAAAGADRTAASPARVVMAAARPDFNGTMISEGERQALEINGVVGSAFDGSTLYADDYGVEVKTEAGRLALERARNEQAATGVAGRPALEGFTHVYPSIAPGVLDPAATVRGAVPASALEQE